MYSTPEFEDLVARIKAEPDAAKRGEMAKEAVQLQYAYANLVSLYDSVNNFAHSKSVTNIQPLSAATSVFYVGEFKPAQ
jgi:ABC-type transport system substrate-binding protein